MKPLRCRVATFNRPCNIPGKSAASSVTADKRTEVFVLLEQRALAVVYQQIPEGPVARPPIFRLVPFEMVDTMELSPEIAAPIIESLRKVTKSE